MFDNNIPPTTLTHHGNRYTVKAGSQSFHGETIVTARARQNSTKHEMRLECCIGHLHLQVACRMFCIITMNEDMTMLEAKVKG